MNPEEHPYVALARAAIHEYSARKRTLQPGAEPGDPPPACVFVSLHEPPGSGELEGPLRGCIGSVEPREENLRREIARSAVAAAFSDPRFRPLTPREIDRLEVTVYVLGEPEQIEGLSDLDPARYGVLIEGHNGRRGILLPAIAAITTASRQVMVARQKAGLASEDPAKMSRFTATVFRSTPRR